MADVAVSLDFSTDPLSETNPSWTDVTPYLLSAQWSDGRTNELDSPQGGSATFVLNNNDRRFEPQLGPTQLGITTSGNEITDALRVAGPTGDGRPYRNISNVFDADDVAQTTLSASMTNVQTTASITAWQSQWPLNSAFLIFVDQETMIVTAGHGTASLTVVRGVAQIWGTPQAAAAHSNGAVVTSAQTPEDGWEFKNYAAGGKFSDQAEMVTAPSGNRALKMTVHPGDYNDGADSTRERIEGYWLGQVGDTGERHFYRWSNEFPSDFAANNTGVYIGQFGPNHSAGNAAIYIRVTSRDKFQLGRNAGVLDTGTFIGTVTGENDFDIPVTKGVRHDFIMEVDWELTATGRINLWHRETGGPWQLLLSLSGIITSSSLSGVTPAIKRKHGIYRSANASLTNYLYLYDVLQGDAWEDVQTEPLSTADSSTGIWPAATNILADELLTLSGSTVQASDSTMPLMGAASDRVDFLATNDYIYRTFTPISIGTVYTASIWIYRQEIDSRFLVLQVRNGANSANQGTVNIPQRRGWQKVSLTFTATDTAGRVRVIMTDASLQPVRVWIGRAQLETGPLATPWAGFGTRAAGRVQISQDILNETQGWVAIRARPGWSPSAEPSLTFERLFDWRVDASNHISGFYREDTNLISTRRFSGGVGSDATQSATGLFNVGEPLTFIFAWTATQTKVSVDGAAFSTASNSSVPDLSTATLVDIGRVSSSAAEFLAGDVLWFASGTGTLTDADAAYINGLETDPLPGSFSAYGITATWSGRSQTTTDNNGITPLKRFRLRLSAGSTTYDMGIWYVTDWGPSWPDGFLEQTATVTCVDGFGLLALDALPLMSPADATSYEEVVSFDQPSLYYRLGEPEGTKVVSHARKERKRHKHESRRHYRRHGIRHWTNRVTRAEVEGISGPAGTYKGTPTLAQPGLILGDTATCVLFGAGEYARIGPLDEEDLITRNRLTLEAWVEIVSGTATSFFLGPEVAASPVFTFGLSSNVLEFFIQGTPSNITVVGATTIDSSDGIVHVVGTWDGTRGAVYLNGVEDGSTTQGTTLDSPDPGGYLKIGPAVLGSLRGQEAAVYEKALSAKRVLAHYTAGSARGYAEQLAGDRIEAIVTSDLWSEAGIQTGSFDIQPTFQFGQGKLDEIVEAVDAENPDSHFYFNGTGAPVYLGWDHKADSPYNAAQAVFGNDTAAGEVQYVDLSLSYDDEMFNRVTISADGGEEQTVDDTASQAAYNMTGGSRAFERTGLPLSDDADAATIAGRILDGYATPQFRMTSLSLAGNDSDQRTQILERQIGEPIRVKHRPADGTAIDMYTYILGRSFSLTLGSELHASWTLARGINFGLGQWRLGVDDASNLGETAVLA